MIRIRKNQTGKRIGDEWVLLNLENGAYYGLNPTASLIWEELVKGKEFEAVVDRLQKEFQTDRRKLERDLSEFLKELKEAGFVEEG